MQWVRGAARWSLLAALWQAPAFAQPADDAARAAARDLGYVGVEAFRTGNYALASDKFEKAYRLVRTPSLGLWSARALAKLGKYVEASERYQEVTLLEASGSGIAIQKQAQADAAIEGAVLKTKIPSVVVVLDGVAVSEAKVTLDGAPLAVELIGEARPVNPGRHDIVLERGAERATWTMTVADGERKIARLGFVRSAPNAGILDGPPSPVAPAAPQAAPPSASVDEPQPGSAMRTAGWVAIGAGGAGLVVGGATWLIARHKKNELDGPPCHDNTCPSSETDRVDSYNATRNVSTISFVAGLVLGATGVALYFAAPKPAARSTSVWVAPNGFGVVTRF
jgi:hypothetical protein